MYLLTAYHALVIRFLNDWKNYDMQEKHIIVLDEYFNIALQRVGRDIYTEELNSKMIQETNIELFGIGLFYRLSCLKKMANTFKRRESNSVTPKQIIERKCS